MKRLFKIFLFFFALALTLLLEPSSLQNSNIDITGSIQKVKNETVVLVSNNMLGGEITSYQEKNDTNFSNSTSLVINYQNFDNLLSKNQAQLNGCFIHNLSTDKEKVHQIRAP